MACYARACVRELQVSTENEELKWFAYAEKDQVVGVDKLIFDHLNQHGLLT
jgi:8-oxo-dGTP diphosphatase